MTTESTLKKKPGKLSLDEMKFIEEHAAKMKIEDIANALNRHVEPIQKFIIERGLSVSGQDVDRKLIRERLLKEFFWESTKAQLYPNEQEYFINGWIELVESFNNDVLPSEKLDIKQLLLLEIQKNKAGIALKKEEEVAKQYEELIEKEVLKGQGNRDDAQIMIWQNQVSLARTNIQAHLDQIDKCNKTCKDLRKDLKATRDQRFNKVEAGQTTFGSIIKALIDKSNRDMEGRELELMKMAADKKTEELYEYHEYGDGMVDIPILNHESFTLHQEREKDEKEEGNT